MPAAAAFAAPTRAGFMWPAKTGDAQYFRLDRRCTNGLGGAGAVWFGLLGQAGRGLCPPRRAARGHLILALAKGQCQEEHEIRHSVFLHAPRRQGVVGRRGYCLITRGLSGHRGDSSRLNQWIRNRQGRCCVCESRSNVLPSGVRQHRREGGTAKIFATALVRGRPGPSRTRTKRTRLGQRYHAGST